MSQEIEPEPLEGKVKHRYSEGNPDCGEKSRTPGFEKEDVKAAVMYLKDRIEYGKGVDEAIEELLPEGVRKDQRTAVVSHQEAVLDIIDDVFADVVDDQEDSQNGDDR